MDWNPDPKILTAIENSVAASRWRTAARFEGRETAAHYRRQSDIRSAAATVHLNEVAKAGRQIPTSPRLARGGTGGLGTHPSQAE